MPSRSSSETRAAAVAFALHAPGLRWIAGYRIGPRTRRLNLVAGAATLAAMGAGFIATRGTGMVGAWLAGHLLWSTYLARSVWTGDARR